MTELSPSQRVVSYRCCLQKDAAHIYPLGWPVVPVLPVLTLWHNQTLSRFLLFFLLYQLRRAGYCCLVAQGLQPVQGETLVAVVRRGNEAGTTAAVIYVPLPGCGTKPLMISALPSAQRRATCVSGQHSPEQGLCASCLPASAGSLPGEGAQLWWAGC